MVQKAAAPSTRRARGGRRDCGVAGRRPRPAGSRRRLPTPIASTTASDREMPLRPDRRGRGHGAEARTDKAAGPERRVERGEDRCAPEPLEREPLRVRGHVDRAEAGAEAEQRRGEPGEAGRERRGTASALPSRERGDATARLPTRSHSRPATGIATSAPSEIAKSASPSRGVRQAGVMLHGGDPRRPGAEHQPVAEEEERRSRGGVARITPARPRRRRARYGSRSRRHASSR